MKILVGYSKSNVPESAFKLAKKHAKVFGAEVHLLTSLMQGPDLGRQDIERVESDLENKKMSFKTDGIPCETHAVVSYLTPGEDIVEFAKDNEIDEIIMGVVRKSKVGKLIFGSTAQYVILSATCPVTTVK